jgi:uncharacterized membrane protein
MYDAFHGGALVLAAAATGLMAGVFQLYAHTVMPGLGRADDRTFVRAFQALDRAIINPLFLAAFLGAPVLTALAAGLSLPGGRRATLPWAVAALVLYLAVMVITFRVNVPRNDELKAAGEPDGAAELAALRDRFGEAEWSRWNTVRAVACTAAFGCLLWALVLYGRATG